MKTNTFHLKGNIDLQTSPVVRSEILRQLGTLEDIQLDLSNVTEIDSSGLAILVEAVATAKKTNRKIRLVRFSNQVLKLIRLAHLEDVFSIDNPVNRTAVH